ncbi:MAG: DNA-protecting protein DprA [Legionellales bacterium]|nr:DNA-protecting protein DprA [Legionellales bacterium]
MPTSNSLTLHQLALWNTPGIHSSLFNILIQNQPDATMYFDRRYLSRNPLNLSETILQALVKPPWRLLENMLTWAQHPQHYILTATDDRYPALLKEIHDYPAILILAGRLSLCQLPALAMVGSRRPTAMGQDNAFQFAHTLAQAGLTIVSGLALGIDAASHRGALSANAQTIAVLANGMDVIYPRQHKTLQQKLIEEALVITEFPHTCQPKRWHFPRRNRLISGLSHAILIVEAAKRSGSLITAQHALEQGRDVFALPGSIHNPMAKGCHALIRQGAQLVETTQDIVEEIQSQQTLLTISPVKKSANKLAKPLKTILNAVDYETTALDLIIHRSGFDAAQTSATLTELELMGLLVSTAEGYLRTGS